MKKLLRHTWKENGFGRWKCDCGCEKVRISTAFYVYYRGGQAYSSSPDCKRIYVSQLITKNYEFTIFLFMASMLLFAIIIVYIGKDKKGMYYDQVTRSNYKFLLREFTRLTRNNQDKLRTKRLWASFMEKYRDYWFDSKDLVELQNKIA